MSFNERNLRPAQIGGIRIEVDGDSMPVGRRTADFEYPYRDAPYIEDMGRKKRVLTLDAWVCGDDCFARRDRLIALFEAKNACTLIHPWYGEKQIKPVEATVKHKYEEGRVVRFDLVFAEASDVQFPNVRKDTAGALAGFADELQGYVDELFALCDFSPYLSDALDLSGVNRIIGVLSGAFRGVSQMISGVRDPFGEVLGNVRALLARPEALADVVRAVFAGFAVHTADTARAVAVDFVKSESNGRAPASYYEVVQLPVALVRQVARVDALPIAVNSDQLAIETPLKQFVAYTLVAQAAGVLSVLPSLVKDDVKASVYAVVAAIDALTLRADDEQYALLVRLRAAVLQDYHERMAQARAVKTVCVAVPKPALVLAYEQHENALRDSELILRNKVKHPLFVTGEVKVIR